MATYTSAEPTVGELRYIARLNNQILPNEYPFGDASKTAGSSSTVEGSDVFLVNGQTRSKFYSSERFIDDDSVSPPSFYLTECTDLDSMALAVMQLTSVSSWTLTPMRRPVVDLSSGTSTPTMAATTSLSPFT